MDTNYTTNNDTNSEKFFPFQKFLTMTMVRGRTQGRGQPVENPNPDFMAVLISIQHKLDEQAAFMQQQAAVILDLQKQQGRIINPEEYEDEDEAFNANPRLR